MASAIIKGAKGAISIGQKLKQGHDTYKQNEDTFNDARSYADKLRNGEIRKRDAARSGAKKGAKTVAKTWIMSNPFTAIPYTIFNYFHKGYDHPDKSPDGPPIVVGSLAPWVRMAFRPLQFVMALVVAGMYVGELNSSKEKTGKYANEFIYIEVIAALCAVSALFGLLPHRFSKPWFMAPWDIIIFINWVVALGIFGSRYIKSDNTYMRHAAYIVAVNLVLWAITGAWNGFGLFKVQQQRKAFMPEKYIGDEA